MKILIQTISHSNYEIRLHGDENGYFAAGYRGGKQLTVGYMVSFPTDYDFHTYTGTWAHDHLVTAVRDDIDAGRVAT